MERLEIVEIEKWSSEQSESIQIKYVNKIYNHRKSEKKGEIQAEEEF